MADAQRVVTRQQPITVRVESVKRTFSARPLFWRTRGDFGNMIVAEYSKASAPQVPQIVRDDDEPGSARLEYHLADVNWEALLAIGYPDDKADTWSKLDLDIWEIIELLKAALEVNGLERLAYMVDPRIKDPLTQALDRAAEQGDGLRMPSITDASLPEPTPIPSSVETAPLG